MDTVAGVRVEAEASSNKKPLLKALGLGRLDPNTRSSVNERALCVG
jgi:hypothetical protein